MRTFREKTQENNLVVQNIIKEFRELPKIRKISHERDYVLVKFDLPKDDISVREILDIVLKNYRCEGFAIHVGGITYENCY